MNVSTHLAAEGGLKGKAHFLSRRLTDPAGGGIGLEESLHPLAEGVDPRLLQLRKERHQGLVDVDLEGAGPHDQALPFAGEKLHFAPARTRLRIRLPLTEELSNQAGVFLVRLGRAQIKLGELVQQGRVQDHCWDLPLGQEGDQEELVGGGRFHPYQHLPRGFLQELQQPLETLPALRQARLLEEDLSALFDDADGKCALGDVHTDILFWHSNPPLLGSVERSRSFPSQSPT
ncbi:MAG: hypothetical protein IMZ71_04665 [Chloroflexi bacterium]|nr:hypothetical protein [Chloroflexota bacterium]